MTHLFINEFLERDGHVSFGKFRTKVKTLPNLLNNAKVREMMSHGGESTQFMIYDMVVDFMNWKLKGARIVSRASLFSTSGRPTERQEDASTSA